MIGWVCLSVCGKTVRSPKIQRVILRNRCSVNHAVTAAATFYSNKIVM